MSVTYHQGGFYAALLSRDVLKQTLELFHETERAEAERELWSLFDHAVVEAILHILEESEHEAFIATLAERAQDPALLDWLEERSTGITLILQQSLSFTLGQLHLELQADPQDHA